MGQALPYYGYTYYLMAILTMAELRDRRVWNYLTNCLTVAILTMDILTMAILTMATLTMAILTMAIPTMAGACGTTLPWLYLPWLYLPWQARVELPRVGPELQGRVDDARRH
eukprot:scaffold14109_cov21-Phaeocystis_antarctica.AAC.1